VDSLPPSKSKTRAWLTWLHSASALCWFTGFISTSRPRRDKPSSQLSAKKPAECKPPTSTRHSASCPPTPARSATETRLFWNCPSLRSPMSRELPMLSHRASVPLLVSAWKQTTSMGSKRTLKGENFSTGPSKAKSLRSSSPVRLTWWELKKSWRLLSASSNSPTRLTPIF